MFDSVGDLVGRKRLLIRDLNLGRVQKDENWVAKILGDLSDANLQTGLHRKGISQVKKASEIFEQPDTAEKADTLINLAWLLHDDGRFDTAEEPVSRAVDLLPEEGEGHRACKGHCLLGNVYGSKGYSEKAIHHFELSLRLASSLSFAFVGIQDHHGRE